MQKTTETNLNETEIIIYLLEQEKINFEVTTNEPNCEYIGDYLFQIPSHNKKQLKIEGKII